MLMENFTNIHLLMSIILSILFTISANEIPSLVPLNYTSIIQARKFFMSIDSSNLPDPPMPSYTFTLYHRDVFEKSKFKDYDSMLRHRLARGRTRVSYLASFIETGKKGLVREPATGSTSTYNAEGEHVAVFKIGSDMNRSFLLVDTTGDLVWWQCGPCALCYKQMYHPLYNSTASKTFQNIDCVKEGQSCDIDPYFQCYPEYNNQCGYDVHYESGTASTGFMASEVITFPLDRKSVRIKFGCGQNQMNGSLWFSGSYSGVVGLGRKVNPEMLGAYSLPSQLNATLFSLCLPSFEFGKGSILTFQKAPWPRATMAKLLPNYKFPNLHYVNLYTMYINDQLVTVEPRGWRFHDEMQGGVVVDTGAIITHFPQWIYDVFRETFKTEVKNMSIVENPVGDFDTCYRADQNGEVYFPVVKLYFGSESPGSMLYLRQEQVVTLFEDQYCLAFMGWDRDLTILGTHQLQGVGLTFDTSENTLSFDVGACD